jgi:N-methylhydantoinase B
MTGGDSARWDPIELEVMWQRLLSCADQAAATLLRTSFSTVVAASHDFRYAITDAGGNSLAQSYYGEVMFVTSFPDCVKNIVAAIGRDRIRPGDVYLTNDPWLAAGHLPDIHIATPVFHDGRLVAFSGSVIHISDIGGRFGAHDASEVFEEGICFPVVRLYDRGELNEDVLAILRANVRVPELAVGDVLAQVAANAVGARLIVEFLDEYGLSDLEQLAATLLGRVEAAMRARIAELPDGTFEYETHAETGIATDDVVIRSTITVEGDEIVVDYTGSSPQTSQVGVNCVLNCTRSLTLFPLHAALLPEIPSNEGMTRPIRVTAPIGSVMNAQRPAPVDVRAMITHLLPDHVMGSLAEIIPDRVTAANGIRWMLLADRVRADGGPRTISSFFQAGAMGASGRRDGPNARFFPIRARHTPVERFELDTGLIVERKAIRADSGGAGRHRGGCGQDIVLRNPGPDTVRFSFYRPQTRRGARGYFGGLDGRPGVITVNGEELDEGVLTLEPGDTANLQTPGGGGFGDPAERDAEAVRDDLRQGYVTALSADQADSSGVAHGRGDGATLAATDPSATTPDRRKPT